MRQKIPLLFALVMLCCLFLTVMNLVEIHKLEALCLDTRNHVGIIEGKIRRQQLEYDHFSELVPQMRETDEELWPKAEEALALEKDLKAQRRALRKEIEKLQTQGVQMQYTAALYENQRLQGALEALQQQH